MKTREILCITRLGLLPVALLLASCSKSAAPVRRNTAAVAAATAPAPSGQPEPIAPIPLHVAFDDRKVALGKMLYHDPILSHDKSLSCASCHRLDEGGTDRRPRSIGIGGQISAVNAPTVFNSGFNFRQFWDGRADTLEAQVDGPLLSKREMGSTWVEVLGRLRREPQYVTAFAALYADGIQRANVAEAIAEFEHSLFTPNARFDRFLRGDTEAISAEERAGYAKFKGYGCVSCHQGVNVGANMFQRMGALRDYFADRGNITPADFGRFNVTGNEADKFFFKVPSLRNVARTAPYFHDGSAATLEEAVAVMAKYQLGRALPPQDLSDIVKFLQTLTGEYGGQPL